MVPSKSGRTKRGHCPICRNPYREERMVECTKCFKWCCFECVHVTEAVALDEHWICPSCKDHQETRAQQAEIQQTNSRQSIINRPEIVSKPNSHHEFITPTKSVQSRKSCSTTSSRRKLKLQLLQEERELIRRERELTEQSRKLLEEETDDSQDLDNEDIEANNPLVNKLLSLQIENGHRVDENNESIFPLAPIERIKSPLQECDEQNLQKRKAAPEFKSPTFESYEQSSLTPQQCAARRTTPNELPSFGGNSYDWPLFISSYERSTQLCGFDNYENLLRLQKSLKGTAKAAISSFLTLPECVPHIISTLKMLFGRPDQILQHINAICRQPPPKVEKLETLVEFALAVKNLCVSLQTAKLTEYLNNPMLMHELVDKLPPQIKVNWALHRASLQNFNGLAYFADWMYDIATNVCTALPTLVITDRSKQNRQNEHLNAHNSEFQKNFQSSTEQSKCKVCRANCKMVSECKVFQNYPLSDKWKILRDLKLCRLCLKRHRFPCKYPVKCEKNQCQRKHHPLLHKDIEPVPTQSTSTNRSEVNVYHQSSPQGIRFRILPVILKNGNKEVATYAFLDEGSSITMLDESLSEELGLQGEHEALCLKWTGEQQRLEEKSRKVLISIVGDFQGAKQFDFRPARTVNALHLPQQTVDTSKVLSEYPYSKNLPIQSYKNANPQILIGLDNWELALPLRVKEGEEGQPIAAKCRLGWTVFALLPSRLQTSEPLHNYHVCECAENMISNQELHEAVKEYFSVESLGVKPLNNISSKEFMRAENIMQSTLTQEDNRYKIGLIWKYDTFKLPDSREMALQRMECIEKRIKHNPELGMKINLQIKDYIEKGYIRKLTHEELSQHHERVWYLPIFPVFDPNKPEKFRIVWDAAATVQGISLNSMLLKGDEQLASLLGILLRFRERKIGFSADIKEMLLRVGINDEDQHAQRFFWRDGVPDNSLDTYVMTVMTFGATCSPSCAQFVKNTNAEKFSLQYPRAVESIQKNHYVDDLLDTADSELEAIEIAKQVTLIHSKANFEIRNWRSNSEKLMHTMNLSTKNPGEIDMNMGSEGSTEKVLGMWWNLKTDCLIYSLKYNKGNKDVLEGKRKPTKREILRILMSIYDPLGLVSNFLVYLKILLQEFWRRKVTWDEPITEEQFKKWLLWLQYLPDIEELSVPRCYFQNSPNLGTSKIQLHIFVDSSENASAAAAYYLRVFNESGTVECTLVGAKTHVAPIKLQTMPRLELNGALMGARFAKSIHQHMSVPIHDTIYWSDSKVVLSWLRSEDLRKLCKFVAYRIAEIQDISMISNWRYVPTKLNVADEATKWTKQPSLKATDRWFKGPEFLYETEQLWPREESMEEQPSEEIVNSHAPKEPVIKIENFSRFTKVLRTLGYVYKFINICRRKGPPRSIGAISSEELKLAENTLIRMVQKEFYSKEIQRLIDPTTTDLQPTVCRTSSIHKLSPYLDKDEIIRVRGRLDRADCIKADTKRPIILPRESHLTSLIIESYHIAFQHRNHESVVNEIRQKYYIPKLRRSLNKIRRNCQICKIKLAKPDVPEMSPLPECRLATFTSPFTHTGVDYFGPINVMVGRRVEKRWRALFTCLTTRAVHLEMAYNLNLDDCILCFKNFMNRRGRPRHIYCDRGTNIVATERVLREELKKVDPQLIANSFVDPELSFHFNPPLSPHMGGAWERLVKAVKMLLYDALPSRTPTDPLLRSCLITAENIVNSRPLTYLPLDSEESEALTPNHFIIGSSNGDKPIGQLDLNAKVLKYNYLYREQFANKCWRRFVTEYIPELLLRSKWHKQVQPLNVDDIVIICDKDLPRCNWPKGRIMEVTRARDGQVRRAKVQTVTGVFDRPVAKLALLPIEKPDGTTSDSAVPGGSVRNSR